jgi:hypothetical protein
MTYKFRQYYIPDRMMGGIKRYIEDHVKPGGFLCAVICNDLKEAVGRADEENMENLPAFVSYFYNETDMNCWGSEKKFKEWLENRVE